MNVNRVARRVAAVVCVAMAAGTLAGCKAVPSDPFDPIAVRMNGTAVEVVPTGCHAVPINRIKVTEVKDPTRELTSADPVRWAVTFAPPVGVSTFTIGADIAGGTVTVPPAGPLPGGAGPYEVVDLYLAGGGAWEAAFQPAKLAGGQVWYQKHYVSAADFAKQPCS